MNSVSSVAKLPPLDKYKRNSRIGLLRTGESITVAFRSAKVAFFRGAKGDYGTLIDSPVLTRNPAG